LPIVGISSGRSGKVTESLVESVLAGAGGDSELVSLSGKLIRPCEACSGCIESSQCVLQDDFQLVIERDRESDELVFGAPTYFAQMNSKGQDFWERLCFSGRHNAAFPLKDKPAVMVAVDIEDGKSEPVLVGLDRYFRAANLRAVSHLAGCGEYACFTMSLLR